MKKLKLFESVHNVEIDERFHQLSVGNIGNVIYWMKFFDLVRNIPGDIVECGVGRGRSLLIISAINYLLDVDEGGQRRIFGYDSFEGFPEPSIEDKSQRNPQRGEWSHSPSRKYSYSEDFTRLVMREAGLPMNEISLSLTKGFFSDSLKNHPNSPIAILHIDGDLYHSYKDVLERCFGKVSKGGIIVFDELIEEENKEEAFPGARLAVKEFFASNYSKLRVSIGGTYYFLRE